MKRATIIYLVFNAVGLALFIWFVLRIEQFARWEQRASGDFGDSVNFLMTAFPVFLTCCLYSLIFGLKAGLDYVRQQEAQGLKALAIVAGTWATLFLSARLFF